MLRSFFSLVTILVMMTSLFEAFLPENMVSASNSGTDVESVLSDIGTPGPRAIDMNVAFSRTDDKQTHPNEPVSIQLSTSQAAYVLAVYVTPSQDLAIVFPNRKITDNLLTPGKNHMIVSPESGIKIGFLPAAEKGRIILYVSSQPFTFDGLPSNEGQDYLQISHDDAKSVNRLRDSIKAAAKDSAFNLKIITPDDLSRAGEGFGFMGLPRTIQSTQPESVAGVQGTKEKLKTTGQE